MPHKRESRVSASYRKAIQLAVDIDRQKHSEVAILAILFLC